MDGHLTEVFATDGEVLRRRHRGSLAKLRFGKDTMSPAGGFFVRRAGGEMTKGVRGVESAGGPGRTSVTLNVAHSLRPLDVPPGEPQ